MPAISNEVGGRGASIARRLALSAGKASLPPATERVRAGLRTAALPAPSGSAPLVIDHAPAPHIQPVSVEFRLSDALPALSGRTASLQRRQLLSAGKQALMSHAAAYVPASAIAQPTPASLSLEVPASSPNSGRDLAKARRAQLSQQGRGAAAPAQPMREAQRGTIDYAPKVIPSSTQGGLKVTGSRVGVGNQVTGYQRGTTQPVSGSQYMGTESAAAWRAGGPKVGVAKTASGQMVSGTLIRSAVRVTGDEAGGSIAITGKADQRPEDDMTVRAGQGSSTTAQFQRQASPHGSTVFGTNLGRAQGRMGSRDRDRAQAVEMTETGMAITGSALGRSTRMTGDESGACRSITGTQYLAPAKRQAACGFSGGGTAPAAQIGSERADPVTGNKVAMSRSWGGQRVSGMDVEHNPRVTGDAPGSCAILTGSQYQGRTTAERWCEPGVAEDAGTRRDQRLATSSVTGSTSRHDTSITGAARGATRDITGTPYSRAPQQALALPANPVAQIDGSFSINSPQRAAHLRATPAQADDGSRVTGSCAMSAGRVTGNLEFVGRRRPAAEASGPPAHQRISGEGCDGSRITGDSWGDHKLVTGTEGSFAANRNPTERAGKPQAFSGSANFKGKGKTGSSNELVSGMSGYFSKTGARVTLSGGAQT